MATECREFRQRCLLLDIEINERNVIYSIGAVLGEKVFSGRPGGRAGSDDLKKLESFAGEAEFILGHNIISHDIPRLKELDPENELLKKPLIDTLYLSPLAHPENPYHRLVKDYQLVRDSVNDPVQDALLAGRVFGEQWQAFTSQLQAGSELPLFYRSFLEEDRQLAGTGASLAAMGVPLLTGEDLHEAFGWFVQKHGCKTAIRQLQDQLYDNTIDRVQLAYVVAWLSVSGGNSVLPPWVRHRYPEIGSILHRLREVNCGDPLCEYCTTWHNPHIFLNRFFGFDDFRPQPTTEDGSSLQREIVTSAAANSTMFATLPTGGGKSLCYLLPGLMRYQRRNLLTIVISPLQALMKDQVDNFSQQTGTRIAAALYGMLTMPERGEVLESIRLGDIGILYVSPEQLRNRSFVATISQREIGAWVFDEAHCLSKWGHDFRPDYFYAIRFIREFAGKTGSQIPPVQCFTATAKKDVKSEIIDIVRSELGLRVREYEGGHERTNLHYEVFPVESYDKYRVILELLRARYGGSGSVVIYCATKKNTENLAEFLQNEGYVAEAFHAGLENSLKKRIQEQFIAGDTPVICATNAFGMGIDKDDVRLVIHADIPGSLENYLQEAGRAGRDRREAECILVFDEQDIEGQFRLGSMSRLTRREIAQMLRGIRYAARGGEDVVMTAGELLRREEVDIDPDTISDGDTRVRTAVAWLERAGFLERNENNTRVFQGKPKVRNLEEAADTIEKLNLSARQKERWLAILRSLMENDASKGFSADELASLAPFATAEGDGVYETENQRVLRTLHDMSEQGLLSKETTLSAYLRYKVSNSAGNHLKRLAELERELLRLLEELSPEVEIDTPLELDLRQLNQQLLDLGFDYSTPHVLKLILYGWSRDGKGLAGQSGSLTLKALGGNCFTVYLHRGWENMRTTVQIRQQSAKIALQTILQTVDRTEKANASLLVEFSLEQIVAGLKQDLLLLPRLKKPLAAAERALTFMHEQGVIDLQQGLAIFNQAMTLRLYPEERKRRYTKADFSPLKTHYTERNFQIHVMNEYARQALDKIGTAMRLVASYFNDEKDEFVKRYFPDRKKMLERATSEQSYQRIVDDLKNNQQSSVVASGAEKNMLVLAGPGAGKTRVVTHRVAYLLRVERVRPEAVLVLCYNRGAVMSLRKKLRELVGNEMSRVTTLTFHGLALRLTGRSLVSVGSQAKREKEIDFNQLIRDAILLLQGERDTIGYTGDSPRTDLVGRFSHILVDEYQDIDEEQYELVSQLAGRTEQEYDQKMTILAVGDDDQNIYRFRGTNVVFIRRFHEDYQAEKHYLTENYRSTGHIIAAANALIAHNSDRMKTDREIVVNAARRKLPAGGNWQINDPVARGRVQILRVGSVLEQGYAILDEVRRLQSLAADFDPDGCAVLGREWKDLDTLRSIFEAAGMPVNLHWGRGGSLPRLTRIRENVLLLEFLRLNRTEMMTGNELLGFIELRLPKNSLWTDNLRQLTREWLEETRDTEQPVPVIEEYFYEALSDQGRSKNLGSGIFLSTVHSVKGLEFDHVFILGESWKPGDSREMEEERRLYYVAMSRARETLQLMHIDNIENPHVRLLDGAYCIHRKVVPKIGTGHLRKRYTLLGMEDLFLDFAGLRGEQHPTRKALAGLNPGDELNLVERGEHLELLDSGNVSAGRLSRAARKKWVRLLPDVLGVIVVAMVVRNRDEVSDGEFLKGCKGESWEVPLVEVTTRYREKQQGI